MSDNSLTMPFAFHSPQAIDKRTEDKFQQGVQPIPVSVTKIVGELVMVKAEAQGKYTIPNLLVPQAFSEWIRQPTQPGDKGWIIPSNYYLGGMYEGNGVANYSPRGNLTNMVFVPISQKAFANNANRDLNAVFINGPDGVINQDRDGTITLSVFKDNSPLNGKIGIVVTKDKNIYISVTPTTTVFLGCEISGGALVGNYAFVETTSGPSINVKARFG